MSNTYFSKGFLSFLVIIALMACFFVFKPFIDEIIVAMILTTIFYGPYEWLTEKLKGRKKIASLIMCALVIIVIILPMLQLMVYGAKQTVLAYNQTSSLINEKNLEVLIRDEVLSKAEIFGVDGEKLKSIILELAGAASATVFNIASIILKSTTNFFVSLIWIVLTMFFFFLDGKRMLQKLMHWTPLPNKYDRLIFEKFKNISKVIMISTFLTAIAQGIIGAIGFAIVGLPVFFPALFMAILSLLPYVGAALIWFPAAVYLLVIGNIWQGILLLIWGAGVVSFADNVIKAWLLKKEAQVNPIFIIFSIIGGISLFGFFGIIFGPLIISLMVTVMHLYELEYANELEQ